MKLVDSFADVLRSERNGRTVPLTLFYANFKNDAINICYGFVEGKDDPSYYRGVIERQLQSNCMILLYPSNGKENVKYIFDTIRAKGYPRDRIVYFMDRDLSSMVEDDNLVKDEYVYITDNYSIENDILNENTLLAVLQDILGFSSLSINDKDSIKALYREQLSSFQNYMLPIMATIVIWKRKSIKHANYNNLETKKMFRVNDGKLSLKISKAQVIKQLFKSSSMDYSMYDPAQTDEIIKEIQQKRLSAQIIRGKYLSDFFVMFCNSLYCDYERIGLNKSNKGRELSKRDIMETAAPRCCPPKSLITFIDKTICYYFNKINVA